MTGIVEIIQMLPVTAATTSRDYGRGYAQAIRDVTTLLAVVPEYGAALADIDRYLAKKRREESDIPCGHEGCRKVADAFGYCPEHLPEHW